MIREIKESGIILVGYQDSRKLDEPIGLSVGIAYIDFFAEREFFINAVETELDNPNFGKPKLYRIRMQIDYIDVFPIEGEEKIDYIDVDVHHSRIIVVKMER